MSKKYIYDKCVIYVTNININYKNIHKATENFLKKVLKEKNQNGNCNTSGNF